MSRHAKRLRDHFRGRQVLVTGGLGFVGGHVVRQLLEAGSRVRVLRNRPLQNRRPPEGVELVHGDLLDPDVWERLVPGVDTVFHLAAQTSARASERDPALDYALNVEATRRLLFACEGRRPAPEIVFAGTQTQCGAPTSLPLTGRELDNPLSFYDLHKLLAEQCVEYFARCKDVKGTTLRLPTLYGPGGRESAPDCGVVSHFVEKALRGLPLTVYGGGARVRDFLFAEDAATAFLLAACAMDRCVGRHFVIGTEVRHTVEDLASTVADAVEGLTGRRPPITRVPAPADEPLITTCDFAVDCGEFRSATGWRAEVPLRDGIVRTVSAAQSAIESAQEPR